MRLPDPSAADPALFDPLGPEFTRNPYPAYARLRALNTPYYFAPFDIWLFARFADVQAAALNPLSLRSLDDRLTPEEIEADRRAQNWHDMPYHARFVQFSLLNSDGAMHQRLRRLVFGEFTPPQVERLKSGVEAYVSDLFDAVGSEFDFINDLAVHVPGRVIGRFLGVPDADCAQLRIWSEDIVQYFDIDRTDARKALAERTTRTFYDYLIDLSNERRKRPQDDLISRLLRRWDAGELSEDEYISTCMLILMAGHGSTIDAMGNGLTALLNHPEQLQRLRADPGLMPTAIQEMFRYDAPLPFFHRLASEDMDVNGWEIPKGTKIGLLYASANRDPEAFDNADRFEIGRTPNRHLAFAAGPHFCLGNHLSRMNMEATFMTLLSRFQSIALTAEPQFKPSLSLRGPKALPLRVN
ncbi:cytochrome P450 [Asticcacaulis excentricus]|uniref:Cytochrome P450 n=1 Tax=Asticcacaulis excentricus (strain ATCC 15261 / DSM 4724 / KCTC 12464 / NCIMB 9791 / VKM B-1370 / CB 48) TaxID=573065 RepID=E8RPT3_ASTEC|nr:cytochrome P450 [Asticcacaulis excentricus]ADU12060.1 cytochrome P450 [Asticcacaulis excentricus CB 48]